MHGNARNFGRRTDLRKRFVFPVKLELVPMSPERSISRQESHWQSTEGFVTCNLSLEITGGWVPLQGRSPTEGTKDVGQKKAEHPLLRGSRGPTMRWHLQAELQIFKWASPCAPFPGADAFIIRKTSSEFRLLSGGWQRTRQATRNSKTCSCPCTACFFFYFRLLTRSRIRRSLSTTF